MVARRSTCFTKTIGTVSTGTEYPIDANHNIQVFRSKNEYDSKFMIEPAGLEVGCQGHDGN